MADIWTDLTDAIGKDMSIDEMKKKYENTYLILQKANGEEAVVLYKGFDGKYHQFRDEMDVLLKFTHETDAKIICKFPERCMFNSEQMALEFLRLPTRQYRRGICKENIRIYSPVRNLWNGDSHAWTMKTLIHALYPKYPSCCEEAIKELVGQNVVSIALNEHFFLSQSVTSRKEQFMLFFSNKVIGYFEKDTFVIKHPLFKQEVLDNINLFKPYRIEF